MGQDHRQPQRSGAPDRTASPTLAQDARSPRNGLPSASPRWWWPTVLALSMATSSVAALVLPAVIAAGVDRALSGDAGAGVAPLAAVLCLLTAAETLAQYAGPRATAEATARLRAALIRHVMAVGPYPARRTATGDLVARLTASAAEAGLSVQAAVYAVAQLVMAAGSVLALGLLAPELAAAFGITAPVGWLLLRRHLRRTVQRGEGYQGAQAAVAARLLDALAGRRTIAAAGTVEREIERVLAPVPELSRHGRALWDSQRRVAWSTGLLAPATQITVIAVAGYELSTGALGPGGLVAALGYATLGLGGSAPRRVCWTTHGPEPDACGSTRSSRRPGSRRACAACRRARGTSSCTGSPYAGRAAPSSTGWTSPSPPGAASPSWAAPVRAPPCWLRWPGGSCPRSGAPCCSTAYPWTRSAPPTCAPPSPTPSATRS